MKKVRRRTLYTFDKVTLKYGIALILFTAVCVLALAIINKYRPEARTGYVYKADAQYAILHTKYPRMDYKTYKIIVREADRYGDDVRRVCQHINAESGFYRYAVSASGAQGLLQLMPKTAAALGVKDPFNVEQNITGGMKHYHKTCLRKARGNHFQALRYYNAGHNRTKFSASTNQYAHNVMRGVLIAGL